jgi:hypothetical protein
MPISYSGLTSYGKNSLPSVESWGGNLNILRDPPKSITTRRIDKVGQTSYITDMIDESTTRSDEAILRFARGVNPSVSVSYTGEGNNGGNRSGNIKVGGTTEAYLPYRILNNGSFRPPILTQFSLLPTSRMPRNTTSVISNPGFIDYSKKRLCQSNLITTEIKKTTITPKMTPTAVFKLNTQSTKESDVKHKIKDIKNIDASSGIRTMDRSNTVVIKPTKMNTPMFLNILPTMVSNISKNGKINMKIERFIQETNHHSADTNPKGREIQGGIELETGRYIQSINNHSTETNPSGYEIHGDNEMETGRYTQQTNIHSVDTNKSRPLDIYGETEMETGRYTQSTNVHSASTNKSRPIVLYGETELETGRFIQDANVHSVDTNKSRPTPKDGETEMHTHKYIQDANTYSTDTNPMSSYGTSKLIDDNSKYDIKTKNLVQITYDTIKTGTDKVEYIHSDIIKNKIMPTVTIEPRILNVKKESNPSESPIVKQMNMNKPSVSTIRPDMYINKNINTDRPAYKLHETPSFGGYSIPPSIPRFNT